jgi:hypothetical protein
MLIEGTVLLINQENGPLDYLMRCGHMGTVVLCLGHEGGAAHFFKYGEMYPSINGK